MIREILASGYMCQKEHIYELTDQYWRMFPYYSIYLSFHDESRILIYGEDSIILLET